MRNGVHADGIQKSYPTRSGPLVVLRDISLTLSPGDAVAVIGPSGAGKSTLLNILGTLEPPTTGTLHIDGQDPFTLSEPELADFRNRRVGFVFQDHHLLPQCSLLENVLIPTLPSGTSEQLTGRARELLQRVGLADRLDHLPSELSGGERQRAAIARAMMNKPRLILADEPTGNLDQASADGVANLLLEMHHEQEAVLIVVTHSMALSVRMQRRYEISDGRLTPNA